MKKTLTNWVLNAFCLFILSYLFKGIHFDGFMSAMLAALVLSIVNRLVKPVLTILSIPVTIITLGFFLLVINTLMLLLTAKIVSGFTISGFWTAFFASIVLSVLNSIFIEASDF